MAEDAGVEPQLQEQGEQPVPGQDPAGEQPPAQTAAPTKEEALDWLQSDDAASQLEQLLMGEPTPKTIQQTPPTETSPPPASEEQPPPADPAATADPPTQAAPKRVRLTGLSDEDAFRVNAAVRSVQEGDAPDLATALARMGMDRPSAVALQEQASTGTLLGQEEPPSKPPAEGEPPAAPAPEASPEIVSIQAKLATARETLTQARDNLDAAEEIAKLEEARDDLVVELAAAKAAVVQEQASDRSYTEQARDTAKRLQGENPDLANPASPLFQRVLELRELAEYRGDPVLARPDFLNQLVDQAKKDIGTRQPSPAQAPPILQQQPRQRQAPVGQLATPQGAAHVSEAAILASLHTLDETDKPFESESLLWNALELADKRAS